MFDNLFVFPTISVSRVWFLCCVRYWKKLQAFLRFLGAIYLILRPLLKYPGLVTCSCRHMASGVVRKGECAVVNAVCSPRLFTTLVSLPGTPAPACWKRTAAATPPGENSAFLHFFQFSPKYLDFSKHQYKRSRFYMIYCFRAKLARPSFYFSFCIVLNRNTFFCFSWIFQISHNFFQLFCLITHLLLDKHFIGATITSN